MESFENDAGRILGMIAGVFYLIGAAIYAMTTILLTVFVFNFLPGLPPPPAWQMIPEFVWGAATGAVMIFISIKYAGLQERKTRVIAGAIIIALAFAGSLPTGGGAGFGIILAIAAGIITIIHKNYRQNGEAYPNA